MKFQNNKINFEYLPILNMVLQVNNLIPLVYFSLNTNTINELIKNA